LNEKEIDHVTILAITGDQFTFENIDSVSYDEGKEAFFIKQKDGTLNFLPRESMVIFAEVQKQEADLQQEQDTNKIISILDKGFTIPEE